MKIRIHNMFFLIILFIFAGGCAASSTAIIDEEIFRNQKPMTYYKSLIINTFELSQDIYASSPGSVKNERELRYSAMPDAIANSVIKRIVSRQIYQTVSKGGTPSSNTLVLKGKFTRVGRFRISLTGTLHDGATDQEIALFRETLWDVYDTTQAINLLSQEMADFIDRMQYK